MTTSCARRQQTFSDAFQRAPPSRLISPREGSRSSLTRPSVFWMPSSTSTTAYWNTFRRWTGAELACIHVRVATVIRRIARTSITRSCCRRSSGSTSGVSLSSWRASRTALECYGCWGRTRQKGAGSSSASPIQSTRALNRPKKSAIRSSRPPDSSIRAGSVPQTTAAFRPSATTCPRHAISRLPRSVLGWKAAHWLLGCWESRAGAADGCPHVPSTGLAVPERRPQLDGAPGSQESFSGLAIAHDDPAVHRQIEVRDERADHQVLSWLVELVPTESADRPGSNRTAARR